MLSFTNIFNSQVSLVSDRHNPYVVPYDFSQKYLCISILNGSNYNQSELGYIVPFNYFGISNEAQLDYFWEKIFTGNKFIYIDPLNSPYKIKFYPSRNGNYFIRIDEVSGIENFFLEEIQADLERLKDTSGINTGDQDLSGYQQKLNIGSNQILIGGNNITGNSSLIYDSANKKLIQKQIGNLSTNYVHEILDENNVAQYQLSVSTVGAFPYWYMGVNKAFNIVFATPGGVGPGLVFNLAKADRYNLYLYNSTFYLQKDTGTSKVIIGGQFIDSNNSGCLNIVNNNATNVVLFGKGETNQSAKLIKFDNVSGTEMFSVGANGAGYFAGNLSANNLSGTNTGDETQLSIQSKLSAGQILGTSAKFGDASNYLQIATDGTVTLTGNATIFDDLLPSSIVTGVGQNAPTFTGYNGSLRAYEFVGIGGSLKEINLGFQLPHSWKEGSTIEPHIHLYIPDDTTGGVIKFSLEYTWANIDSSGLIATTTISGTLTRSPNQGIANNSVLSFGMISGSGKTASSILMARLYRDPADLGDTFGASAWLKSADIHIEKDKLGASLAP